MAKFEEQFFGLLVDKSQFYIKNYYSESIGVNKWIAILEKDNYVYAVVISEMSYEHINYWEATSYMKEKYNKNIIINVVVPVQDDDYKTDSNEINNILVYSLSNKSVIYSGDSCKSLIPILNFMERITESKGKEKSSKIVTYILIFINVLIFIITAFLSQNLYNIDVYTLVLMGAKFNEFINRGQLWRFITAAFLHGGLTHVTFNMYALNIIGGEVEYSYGKIKYMAIYICSAISGSIFSYIFNRDSVSVGASGAVFGLFGAMLVYGFNNRKNIGKAYMMNILKVIGVNILIGVTISTIDNSAHIGGLLTGAIVAIISSLTIGGNRNEPKKR